MIKVMRLINNPKTVPITDKIIPSEAPIEPIAILKLHAHASKQVRNAFFKELYRLINMLKPETIIIIKAMMLIV